MATRATPQEYSEARATLSSPRLLPRKSPVASVALSASHRCLPAPLTTGEPSILTKSPFCFKLLLLRVVMPNSHHYQDAIAKTDGIPSFIIKLTQLESYQKQASTVPLPYLPATLRYWQYPQELRHKTQPYPQVAPNSTIALSPPRVCPLSC